MVRLKVYHDSIVVFRYEKFQFQYGAIKSIHATIALRLWFQFQFQYGAIKRLLHICGCNI